MLRLSWKRSLVILGSGEHFLSPIQKKRGVGGCGGGVGREAEGGGVGGVGSWWGWDGGRRKVRDDFSREIAFQLCC